MSEPRLEQYRRPRPAGPCELCDTTAGAFVTDHCHKHGWVRGALCLGCNSMLGAIERGLALRRPISPERVADFLARCTECEPITIRTAALSNAEMAAEAAAEAGAPVTFGQRLAAAMPASRKMLAWLLILVVMSAVAAMSWSGLYGFAHNTMRWTPGHAALVPIALDVAALSCALLALDSLSRNDPALAFRVLTAALVGLSAFVNWRHALGSGNIAEEVFFPAMSILSYLLIDAVLRKYRRDTRRELAGYRNRQALEPLPRYGILAAVMHPRRALAATRQAVARRIPDISETTAEVPALEGLTQAAAIRRAIDAVGQSPREVVAWLEGAGWPNVAPQRVYDVIRRDGVRQLRPVDASETAESAS